MLNRHFTPTILLRTALKGVGQNNLLRPFLLAMQQFIKHLPQAHSTLQYGFTYLRLNYDFYSEHYLKINYR